MAEVDAFGKVLFETISGNKLSASRVDRVKDHATRCFHDSSLMVKMILKCHKKASRSTKVSSLYLFDAVVRHAADIVRKQGHGFDTRKAKAPKASADQDGTTDALVAGAKTFLATAQLAVEEMCLDTMASVSEEQQEKVKKVIDIWIKAGTFDSDFLSRLQASVESSDKDKDKGGSERSTTPPGDPRDATRRPYYRPLDGSEAGPSFRSTVNVNAVAADPSALLASLSGVLGNLNAAALPPPTSAATPNFDLSQLARLQQLTATSSHQSKETLPPHTGPSKGAPGPPPPPPSRPSLLTEDLKVRSQSPSHGQIGQHRRSRSRSPQPSNERDRRKRTRWGAETSFNDVRSPSMDNDSGSVVQETLETLATFDMSTFDPTQPDSWQRVAKMWENTYGYMPSNQELMMCMMMGSLPPPPPGIAPGIAPSDAMTASGQPNHLGPAGTTDSDGWDGHVPNQRSAETWNSENDDGTGYVNRQRNGTGYPQRPTNRNASDDRGPSESFTIPTTR